MKRIVLTIGVALVFGVAGQTEAGFLSGFTGNTVFGKSDTGVDRNTGDGNVNFAVYDNAGDLDGDWTTNAEFLGINLLDVSDEGRASRFVYMYQVVNTDPNPTDASTEQIRSFRVPVYESGNVTAKGSFETLGVDGVADGLGFVFNDTSLIGSATGPNGNRQLGAEDLSTTDTFADQTPTESGVSLAALPFFPDLGTRNAADVDFSIYDIPPPGGTDVLALEWMFMPGIGPGGYSNILFFASNSGPQYDIGNISNGGSTFGDVPTLVPAPGGLALVLAGLPGLLGLGWFQRRRKTTVV